MYSHHSNPKIPPAPFSVVRPDASVGFISTYTQKQIPIPTQDNLQELTCTPKYVQYNIEARWQSCETITYVDYTNGAAFLGPKGKSCYSPNPAKFS